MRSYTLLEILYKTFIPFSIYFCEKDLEVCVKKYFVVEWFCSMKTSVNEVGSSTLAALKI